MACEHSVSDQFSTPQCMTPIFSTQLEFWTLAVGHVSSQDRCPCTCTLFACHAWTALIITGVFLVMSIFVRLGLVYSCVQSDILYFRGRSAQDPPNPTRRLFLTQTSTVWENGPISNYSASTGLMWYEHYCCEVTIFVKCIFKPRRDLSCSDPIFNENIDHTEKRSQHIGSVSTKLSFETCVFVVKWIFQIINTAKFEKNRTNGSFSDEISDEDILITLEY